MKKVRCAQFTAAAKIMGFKPVFMGIARHGKERFLKGLKRGYPINIYYHNDWMVEKPFVVIKAGEA